MDKRDEPPSGLSSARSLESGRETPPSALLRWVPGLTVFRDYHREWLRADLLAGVSVSVVMTPSFIAYAGLVGLPPQHGFYAALVRFTSHSLV